MLWPLSLAVSITLLSGRSIPPMPPHDIIHIDKLAHLLVFGLLATAIYRAFPPTFAAPRRTLWAICLTIIFGLADELHQGTTPGRTMDFWDWLADALGAVIAVGVYRYWGLYRAVLEWRVIPRRRDSSAAIPAAN